MLPLVRDELRLLPILLPLLLLVPFPLLFQGGGGGRRLRLGVGKLSSALTVARVVKLSSKGAGAGCKGGDGGGESDPRAGRTVESDEAKEVEVEAEEAAPLLFPVPETELPTLVVVRSFLALLSSAFGVEASEVVAAGVWMTGGA